MDIYIKIILSDHIINNINLELNNFKKNIFKIKFKNAIIFILKIKYYWDIKGNNIEIYILSLIWRVAFNILKRNI